jgi:cob(I)alamin adenosyltransferase
MSERPFDQPRLAINSVYTRQGDGGDTKLAGGQTVGKDSLRIHAGGSVDELNAFLGLARATAEGAPIERMKPLAAILVRVQHELFNLGSMLATLLQDVHPRQARVTEAEIAQLEREMDAMNRELEPLRSFVLPGGSPLNAELHVARAVCRRAERAVVALARAESIPPEAVRYLNRLGDAVFVWARWASHAAGTPETLWDPNGSSSGLIGG